MSLTASLIIGLSLSGLIGLAAYCRGALTRSGVLGAILTGTAIFGFGGLVPGLLLVAFFISSSLLSHYQARAKEQFSEKFQKGSQRDFGQALANGGWAAILAVGYGLARLNGFDLRVQTVLFAAFVGAIATVTADTWATEIGVLSPSAPRMITTGRTVPSGTSGGITALGTVSAFLGGGFIGGVVIVGGALAVALNGLSIPALQVDEGAVDIMVPATVFAVLFLASASGLGGALFDSILGATVQGNYFCEYDEVQTEKKIHSCGRATRLVRGWSWLDNDLVNFLASVMGSLIAFLLANSIL